MKKTACLAVFFGLCVLVVSVSAGEMHTWTASNGDTIEAEFVEVSQDKLSVTLRKKDGEEIQMAMEELSTKDQEFIKKSQNFTGIRCEYRAATDDGTLKDVFLLKAVFPGSPAEKAGLSLTNDNLYFRPQGAKAKPEDIIDGFYHPKTRVASITILSTSTTSKETPKIVKVNCISKSEWEILVAAEDKVRAVEVRTWTSSNGNTYEAKFIELSKDGETVTLRDEKNIAFKLEQFSESDKKYVAWLGTNATTAYKPTSIITNQDCIDTVLSVIDDAADRETVLKWLQNCKRGSGGTFKYDKVKKHVICFYDPMTVIRMRLSYLFTVMFVYPDDNRVSAHLAANTCDNDAMFPKQLIIADKSGVIWESSRAEWSHDVDSYNGKVWVREQKVYSINEFTEKDADAVMGAIAKNDECVVRISGSEGYRDIDVPWGIARGFKLFYDAYKVLKKYYK